MQPQLGPKVGNVQEVEIVLEKRESKEVAGVEIAGAVLEVKVDGRFPEDEVVSPGEGVGGGKGEEGINCVVLGADELKGVVIGVGVGIRSGGY